MAEKKKPNIDKEYLKKLAEKIKQQKEERAKKTGNTTPPEFTSKPPVPPVLMDDDEEDEMAAEKTAIIDLASLSGNSSDAKLTLVDGKDAGKSLDITRDEIFARRSLDNDFVISDISVSRKHFKIVRNGDAFTVSDMGSGNGIRVNGEKTSNKILYHNDVISAGARTIKFEILNEEIRKKYSNDEKVENVYVAKGGSKAAWVAVLFLIAVIGVGAYFVIPILTQQKGLTEQENFEYNDLKLGKILDDLHEKNLTFTQKRNNLEKAQKLLYKLLATKQNSKSLQKKSDEIRKEKEYAEIFELAKKNYELAKQSNLKEKIESSEKSFRKIPMTSFFFQNVIDLLGKEKVFAWLADDAKKYIKTKNADKATEIIAFMKEADSNNPEIAKIEGLMQNSLGQQSIEIAKKKLAEKRLKKQKILEEKKRRMEALRAKKAGKKIVKSRKSPKKITKHKKIVKKIPKPTKKVDPFAESEDSSDSYSMDDIDTVIDLFRDKKFEKAYKKIKKIVKKSDGKIKEKAKKLMINIKKFNRFLIGAKKSTSKQAAFIKVCKKYDNKITGGDLSDYLSSLKKSSTPKKASKEEIKKAKKLYMEGRSMRESDPETAREKLEKVLEIVPPSNKYYKKAKKVLRKMD